MTTSAGRGHLLTEQAHPLSTDLDQLSTSELVQLFAQEDLQPQQAVAAATPALTEAIDAIAARLRQAEGPFGERAIVDILGPAIDALAFAHELGIAHRDIKPANVFRARTVRGETTKILDFDTNSTRKPLQMVWCGEDAVLLSWQVFFIFVMFASFFFFCTSYISLATPANTTNRKIHANILLCFLFYNH